MNHTFKRERAFLRSYIANEQINDNRFRFRGSRISAVQEREFAIILVASPPGLALDK